MKHSNTHSSYGTQIQPVNLNLESHKVVEFMGEMDEWYQWKSSKKYALDGSGYKQVLTHATYDGQITHIWIAWYIIS